MSKNNLFFLFLYCFILFQIFTTSNGKAATDGNDCSQYKEMIDIYKLKIDDLEKKNKKLELEVEELREWKRKEQEKKGEEEEEEEEPDQTEIDLFKNIDSKIINTQEEFSLLYKRLKKNFKEITDFKLLYRGSADGKSSTAFHEKCDGIGNTISIIRSNAGYKFGGYAVNKWTKNAFTWVYDDLESFVFSLNLMTIYDSTSTHNEKYHLGTYSGPQFWAFTVADDTGYSLADLKPFGDCIQSIYHDGNGHFSGFPTKYEINGGKSYYYVDEIEVFQIVYKN